MPSPSPDVLVVGAGPVGLTMAAALVQHGLHCRLIDKATAPSDKSKALVVWSRTLELLDNLGLASTFVDAGLKVSGASIYNAGERLVHLTIAGVESPFGYPLMIPQNETELLLTQHLTRAGVQIERQVELLSFGERSDKVASVLRHADGREEPLETPWLVGCDGAHSTVRHGLGLPFTGEAEPNDWMLADVHVEGPLATGEISVFWHTKGILVFFPITRTRFRVIADLGVDAGGGKPPDPTLAEVQAKVDERGPAGVKLSDPIWLAGFRINERKVADYRRGRVFLAGDAAHIHSPAGGQGMNTGMQDAFNLAWKLALVHRGAGQAEPLLGSYSTERSAVGDQVLRGAEMLTTVATLRNPAAQFLRNHVASLASSFGFVQDKIKNALCELSINYRHSPLSAEQWPTLAGGLPAGDRLPDAPLRSAASGRPTTLFAATMGVRHALLLLSGSHEAGAISQLATLAETVEHGFPGLCSPQMLIETKAGQASPAVPSTPHLPVWLDAEGAFHRRLGVTSPAVVLVRPDGYLSYRGQPADGAALLNYLARFYVRRG